MQEKFLGQGAQDNEVCLLPSLIRIHPADNIQSAVEQAKDEQISDFIRGQYKGVTGKDVPIQDKETRLG